MCQQPPGWGHSLSDSKSAQRSVCLQKHVDSPEKDPEVLQAEKGETQQCTQPCSFLAHVTKTHPLCVCAPVHSATQEQCLVLSQMEGSTDDNDVDAMFVLQLIIPPNSSGLFFPEGITCQG